MERKIVITLSRQYCSGGLKVGKRLAEDLGINCYDSEMFRLVSDGKAMTDNEGRDALWQARARVMPEPRDEIVRLLEAAIGN